MTIGRDAAVLAGAALLGAALAALVVLRPGDVQCLANWLSPVPPPPFAAPGAQRGAGSVNGAAAATRVTELARRVRDEPAALGAEMRDRTDLGGPVAPPEAEIAALLAQVPDGLGAPPPAGDAARTFVTATLLWLAEEVPLGELPSAATSPLATVVNGDAGRLVAVLSAWSALDAFVPSTYPAEVDGAEMLRAMMPRGEAGLRRLCDGLAALTREPSRPALDRALAGYALGEIADLPLGLALSLPSEDDAAARPTEEIAATWSAVRELRGSAAFDARVRLAARSGPSADTWLRRHLGPGASVSALQRRPAAVLRAQAGGARSTAEILARMEQEPTLRLPLHHLLTLEGAAGNAPAPRVTASSDGAGVVVAWRRALGLADVPLTLRVAHVDRRLDGLTILDESVRTLRAGTPVELRWSEDVVEGLRASCGWSPPGATTTGASRAHMTEVLRIALRWSDDGAVLVIETLDVAVTRPGSSGSTGESGASWPAVVPTARGDRGDADSPAGRRAFLIVATPGAPTGSDTWTLDDWRGAAATSFDRLQRRAAAGDPAHRRRSALYALGDALALLRPDLDADRLAQLTLDAHGLGPGVARALAFAGRRVLAAESEIDVLEAGASGFSSRDLAELALDAPDPDERLAAGALLVRSKPPTLPVAEELLQIAGRDDARVPGRVRKAAEDALARASLRGGAVYAILATILWAVTALLLLAVLLRRKLLHRARVAATLLLIAALVVAQVDIVLGGTNLTPAWAGWALAALAAWQIGRGHVRRQATVAATAFGGASLASLGAPTTSIVAALAAITGCVALGPLAVALIAGIGPRRRPPPPPRRPAAGKGWRLALLVALPALYVGGVFTSAMLAPWPQVVSGALHYTPIAFSFGSVLLSRLALERWDTAHVQGLPTPFVLGLVTPAVILLVTTTATHGGLGHPFDSMLRLAIFCALLFALLRLLDAARVRARADARGAEPAV